MVGVPKRSVQLKKDFLKVILDFHNVHYITTMVYFCVPTIRVSKTQAIEKNPTIIGCCIEFLLSHLTNLWLSVHILIFVKRM
jgi:hypothetical protein